MATTCPEKAHANEDKEKLPRRRHIPVRESGVTANAVVRVEPRHLLWGWAIGVNANGRGSLLFLLLRSNSKIFCCGKASVYPRTSHWSVCAVLRAEGIILILSFPRRRESSRRMGPGATATPTHQPSNVPTSPIQHTILLMGRREQGSLDLLFIHKSR